MVQLPHSLVDFADAIKALVSSQSDVTQLVTKWDEIVNTTTPTTVKIRLSDGTEHSVDNLAKIRNDLIEGLSLNRPTVDEINFRSKYGSSGHLIATRYSGYATYAGVDSQGSGPSEDPFDKYQGYAGFVRAIRNDFFTTCIPNKAVTTFNMFELPRVMWLGFIDARNNDATIDNYTFTVQAPPQSLTAQDVTAAWQYCGIVTLINAYTNRAGTPLGDVTVNFIYDVSGSTRTVVIPQQSYVTLLFWAHPGQDSVNIGKIGEGSTV